MSGGPDIRSYRGLARGIDTAAHRASLETGTIAALAGGLDQPYPPENIGLLDEITRGNGLAISEMPFGWEPRARDFPRRNRLIAGVSLGLAVVEAAARSGSLITARYAADFGRLVFAVPGSPLDPRCQGTNGLIKDGATVTTEAQDILQALAPLSRIDLFTPPQAEEPGEHEGGPMAPPPASPTTACGSPMRSGRRRSRLMTSSAIPVLRASAVYLVLLELDLAGRLHRHPGGLVSLSIGD